LVNKLNDVIKTKNPPIIPPVKGKLGNSLNRINSKKRK